MIVKRHKLCFAPKTISSIRINDGWTAYPLIFNKKRYALDLTIIQNPFNDEKTASCALYYYDDNKVKGKLLFKTNCSTVFISKDEYIELGELSENMFKTYLKQISTHIFKLYMQFLQKKNTSSFTEDDTDISWDGVIK